jgi:hypothetical protein
MGKKSRLKMTGLDEETRVLNAVVKTEREQQASAEEYARAMKAIVQKRKIGGQTSLDAFS